MSKDLWKEMGKLVRILNSKKDMEIVPSNIAINQERSVASIGIKTPNICGRTYIESIIKGKLDSETYELHIMYNKNKEQYDLSIIRKTIFNKTA